MNANNFEPIVAYLLNRKGNKTFRVEERELYQQLTCDYLCYHVIITYAGEMYNVCVEDTRPAMFFDKHLKPASSEKNVFTPEEVIEFLKGQMKDLKQD